MQTETLSARQPSYRVNVFDITTVREQDTMIGRLEESGARARIAKDVSLMVPGGLGGSWVDIRKPVVVSPEIGREPHTLLHFP
jgi:hypothetical protein